LVGPSGEQVGIVSINDALRLAQESDLDLVEVAPTARPPVCKLMDYGKFKYESALKARESRKNQTQTVIKEIKIRPKIDPHDYGTKRGHVERFLRQGDKVKVTIMFRGREQSRPELGYKLLQRLAVDVEELGFVESQPKQDGRNMIMVIGPHKKKSDTKVARGPERASARAAAPMTAGGDAARRASGAAAAPVVSGAISASAPPAAAAPAVAAAAGSSVIASSASEPAAAPAAAAPRPAAAAPSRPASPGPQPHGSQRPASPMTHAPGSGQTSPAPVRPAPAGGQTAPSEQARPAAPRPGSAGPGGAAPRPAPKPTAPKPAVPRPPAPKPAAPRPTAPRPAAPRPTAPRSAAKPGEPRPVPAPRANSTDRGAAGAEGGS
jgi:translation initiation factor IF-3